jgi:hypothetical protein
MLFEQAGSSSFNSFQARVERRFGTGFDFISSYTLGHAIDDRAGQGAGRIQNNYDMHGERGDSDFDVRHRWTFSGTYAVPIGYRRRWGKRLSPFANTLLGGWELSGISMLQGGRPFTVYLIGDISSTGLGNDRPNLVPGIDWRPLNQNPDHWINPAALSIPNAGSFGNLGRNTLRGPGLQSVDLAIAKNVALGETKSMQVRVEAFNVFNHPNFTLPNANLPTSSGPSNFGIIPATVSPERQIQFALRWEFGRSR